MKKFYTLVLSIMSFVYLSKAQDTLLYEGFEFQMFHDSLISDVQPPPGNTTDTKWYNWDADGLNDASSAGTRQGWWEPYYAFSTVDLEPTPGDSNVIMASNSWLAAPSVASNWLFTPSMQLGPLDTLFWKSAPFQTPRYMDGYEVRISTTSNLDTDFGTVLFTAAEMTALGSDTTYSTYTFAPSSAFVHGQDATYIDPADLTAANPAHRGRLRPFSVPLTAYANQKVFIAFVHNSTDDNLISIDDIMIRGSHPTTVNEVVSAVSLSVFPNPASDKAQINFELAASANVTINVFDVTGKVVYSESKGTMPNGRHFAQINTSMLAKGFYTVSVQTNNGTSTAKLLVK